MKNNFVSVGKILNFHGVQGEAKLGYSKNREDFLAHLKEVYVQQNGEYKKLEISRLRFTPKCGIIKFKGIDSLNDILEYKNLLIFVTEDTARDFLEEDEFLIDELVGLDVFDGEKKVGSVVAWFLLLRRLCSQQISKTAKYKSTIWKDYFHEV